MSHATGATESSSRNSNDRVEDDVSHYQVLGVAPDAPLEEIRKAYQSLALRFHPDKMHNNGTSAEFIRIDEAWKVLRDAHSRRVYDAELMQRTCREEYFVNEILTVKDFSYNQDENYRYRGCRCGGLYILPDDMELGESYYIACDECSLVVQVNTA
ncbi:dnaJ homolog subfamily C member 24-like [Wyeomyia smithii]|uniref:dnaJ homolog subfamily C member 24-like n=1 Tax=Wyeomyia smithii TaxID=174621 RepID=UPI002467C627|nr:dnaJ homolog subfamily C member 24-like [Wyeomyia smithii]XP_055529704.1 dnaJ homolog subfamily C member 24-like [Wyeomyia smithii]XP_055529705.1 dnaJ homolog subfamily C member 24-like [Wyeomyia smithii]XP_055529706.1 dnaJ homolog subfamily C member 24-like [Wyeomyia smithii]